ncbi:hypothetical protein ACSBQT_10870 [Brevibacterium sp. H602]|uniref:hypothetical protein n=1 Tax=Brevibacterium sp. H602 TaxID=3444316 RepID=UPI003EB7592D
MKKTLTITAVAAALALTGCGSDDTSNEADTAPETTEADTSGTEEAEATAADVQKKLDVFFDSCDWQDHGTDSTPIMYSCESEELFILAGDKSEVKVTTQSVADKIESPVFATITDTYSVYAADKGKINQAWDVLGADPDAKPHEVK